MKLSVGLITYNEEKNLGKTLEAVKEIADEIIVVDSFSNDKTKDIARSYGAKIYDEDWKGYGLQKNSVIDKCSGEWVLLIDADEVVTEKLRRRIDQIINSEPEYEVYETNRCSVCFGKEIKYGGWSNDYVVRLFKKNTGSFNDVVIHESFVTDKDKGRLREKLLHYTYLTIEDYFSKFNRYTSEGALKRFKDGKKTGIFRILFNPFFKFIKMYVLKKGFLDGLYGFILAVFAYIYHFTIQIKLYFLIKDKK